MERLRRATILAALIAGAGPGGTGSAAPPGPGLPNPGLPDAEEMAGLFGAFCLDAFPDEAAVEGLAAERRAVPLTPAQVGEYLHSDPGKGWLLATGRAAYVITVEQPPYRACAIRRMTPSGFPTLDPYLAAINRYAAARGASLVAAGRQDARTPGGADVTAFQHALATPGGAAPPETFLVLLTDYRGRDRGADRGARSPGEDAGNAGVEVRFVHQFPPR